MTQTISALSKDAVISNTSKFLNILFPEPREFTIRLWDQALIKANKPERFCLVLNHPTALRRMFTAPLELNLGEAYIYGDFDIEGDIYAAFAILDHLSERLSSAQDFARAWKARLALPPGRMNGLQGRGPLEISGELHSKDRDARAVSYHYNVGNDFYSLWLDHNMQYSCGYFPTGHESLNVAQEKKLEHICRKLRLKPGERLLDIGCGWGFLAMYAAKQYGVQVLGVTLSERQAEYAQEKIIERGLDDKVRIELKDYRDLTSGSYDKIVSVGMFEHVGRSHLPEYFTHVFRLLKPGGLFLNHGISLRNQAPIFGAGYHLRQYLLPVPRRSYYQAWIDRQVLGFGTFSQRYIFPDGELVLISDANLIAEAAGFEVRDVENLREHYALTIRNWIKNIETNHAAISRVTDEVTYRTWRLYLASSVHGFESGRISVNQTLFSKPVDGKSLIPMSRGDLYANLG
ncbi:MAG: cyclopropane-fatty-acyl-phospholipid synthase [Anaerolineaceae bacterium]|nr:cyclopropane-fatty-acyl-phospholipid synthase [Anaerolineaceae bacterium]